MKVMVFSLAFISLLLFSCKDNTVSDPVSPNQINKTSDATGNSFMGIIPLNKVLMVPGPGALVRNYNIVGKIDFNGEFTGISPNQTTEAEDLKLEILVDARLSSTSTKDPYQNEWMISSESQDRFYVTPDGQKIFEKTYPVLHRQDKLQLVCTFTVTTRGLMLDDIVLKIPKDQRT
jgi:hypothetical protein